MTGRVSRHDLLRDGEGEAVPARHESCPCCGEALRPDAAGAHHCATCGYPRNVAAWVAYDGCC